MGEEEEWDEGGEGWEEEINEGRKGEEEEEERGIRVILTCVR